MINGRADVEWVWPRLPPGILSSYKIERSPIAYGGEQSVYLLHSQTGKNHKVLKVWDIFELNHEKARAIMNDNKNTLLYVEKMYGELRDFVEPEENILIKNEDGRATILTLQNYLEITDYNILNTDSLPTHSLQHQYDLIVGATQKEFSNTGMVIDLFGEIPNIVIVKNAAAHSFRCIDAHILYYFDGTREQYPSDVNLMKGTPDQRIRLEKFLQKSS